mmetsp:Transcript_19761/g.27788  ORF Transcript_19761/g.27788 Transcript_19761/m.27788 type:complete len:85 (+) Transcript_19761:1131-1385(+)
MPKVMCDEMQQLICEVQNSFVNNQANMGKLRANNIIKRCGKLDYNNTKLRFGNYCQVTLPTTNNNKPRNVGGIALRPASERGSY